jgi:NAD(P)-dependent dehydrogenase (short-subunit alcohol dehydrogenase family)
MGQRLKGKVAIITGGGGGIGRGVVLAMSAEGASVVVADAGVKPDGTKAADIVVAEVKKLGGQAVSSYDSVTTIVSAEKIIDTAVKNFGRVDTVVNCAGNFLPAATVDTTQEQWDSIMAVHLGGHFAVSRAAARQMIKQKSGGSITNFSSLVAFPAFDPRGTSYSTAKAGVMGFTSALAFELKEQGIRVNCIFPQATTQLFAGTNPRGRPGIPATTSLDPGDIAPVIVFFATDEGKNVTGQFVYAAGGDFSVLDRPLKPKVFVRKMGKWTIDELEKVFAGLNLE